VKTPEQIKSELDKLMALDQGGTLGMMGARGAPFAAQALSWVLNEDLAERRQALRCWSSNVVPSRSRGPNHLSRSVS
jgi:hypothetical protein